MEIASHEMLVLMLQHVSSRVSGFPLASPCLWGKPQNLSFLKLSKQVVMSFCVASMTFNDILTCLQTCRKSFCVAGTILFRRFEKMGCIFRGRRSTLETPIVILRGRGRRSTLDVSRCLLYTPYSTLHTPHFTFHTLHSTLYTLHFTLHTLHSTLYIPHSTLHTLHFTLYTLHSTLYTPHSTLYTLHFALRTPESPLHTLHTTFPTQNSTFLTL